MSVQDTSAGYQPAAPITASVSSVLSQDVLTTNTIPVDTSSPNPVAAFMNANSGGSGTPQIEALGIVTPASATTPQLAHIARSSSSESGWVVNPLFDGVTPIEVMAGSTNNTSYGFYIDATGVWWTQLNADGSWTGPTLAWQGTASNIAAAYSMYGELVIYANAGGDLLTLTQTGIGSGFTPNVISMNKSLSAQFTLTMEGQSNWWICANEGGQLVIYGGQLGAPTYSEMNSSTGFTAPLQEVVLGYYAQNTLMCFAIDTSNSLHIWSSASPTSAGTMQQVPNSEVVSATAHVATDNTIHLYLTDQSQNLWVLHQSGFSGGVPNFSAYIPLDTEIMGVASDMNPADAPTLFAIDASDGSLRLHAQDQVTSMWSSGPLLQATDEVYTYTRYRTEVSLVDANGAPVPNYPVTLQVAAEYSAADVWIAGSTYNVSSTAPVQLTTDSLGKVTMAMLPVSGLSASMFTITADNLTTLAPFSPAQPVHQYLSGIGTLNPTQPSSYGGQLPVFDPGGQTLQSAQVYSQPNTPQTLAPGASDSTMAGAAAGAIISGAQCGLGTSGSNAAFMGNLRDGTFRQFATIDEMRAAIGDRPQPDSIGSAIAHFFGDLWEGIKNGVIKIVDFVVTVAEKIANFTVRLLNGIEQAVNTVIQGLEQAAQFIAGVFQAVAAAVEKVVDWLKALFDFAAIWRTKIAFQNMLLAAPAYISGIAENADRIATNWFQDQEAAVTQYFNNWVNQYTPGATFSTAPGWQTPGQPSSTPVANGAAPSDFNNNAHHNWLQNKVSSGAPSSLGAASTPPSADPWTNFDNEITSAGSDLVSALSNFADGIKALVDSNPNGMGNVAMSDFVKGLGELINAALSLADSIVSFVAGLAESGMNALETLLKTELDLGFLNKLWAWLANEAGYPEDETLTIAALASLIAAFPTTILYKLIEGVDTEPFPAGSTFVVAQGMSAMPQAAVLCGAILDLLYVIPQIASDVMATPPQWLTIGMMGLTIIIWVLENGLPDWSTIEWTTAGVIAANLIWLIPLASIIVKAGAPSFYESYIATGDAQNIFFTLAGIGQEVFGMIAIVNTDGISTATALSDFMSPLSNMFSVLGNTGLKEDPVLTALKVVMDFISYFGGGIAQIEAAVG